MLTTLDLGFSDVRFFSDISNFLNFFFSSENQVFGNVIKNVIEMLLKTIKRLRDDFSVNVIRY